MCGVIGFNISNTEENYSLVKRLFIESTYRGLHSIGISFIEKGHITTIKSKDIDKFLSELIPTLKSITDTRLIGIGHCRYSTSFIDDLQPVSDEHLSLAFNGVVTQKNPNKWLEEFGVICNSKNDAEILFNKRNQQLPISEFYEERGKYGSFSVVELNKNGEIFFYRNEFRPLWYTTLTKSGVIIGSTKDILNRTLSSLDNIKKCKPFTSYRLLPNSSVIEIDLSNGSKINDLQLDSFDYKLLNLNK